jgi:hypothetical protein
MSLRDLVAVTIGITVMGEKHPVIQRTVIGEKEAVS